MRNQTNANEPKITVIGEPNTVPNVDKNKLPNDKILGTRTNISNELLDKLVYVRSIESGTVNNDVRIDTLDAMLKANVLSNYYFCWSDKVQDTGEYYTKLDRTKLVGKRGHFQEVLVYISQNWNHLTTKKAHCFCYAMSDRVWFKKSQSNSDKNKLVQPLD